MTFVDENGVRVNHGLLNFDHNCEIDGTLENEHIQQFIDIFVPWRIWHKNVEKLF
jgi:hypothetical protein